MRAEFHSNLSPFESCSSLSSSRLITLFRTNPPFACGSLPPLTGGRQKRTHRSPVDFSEDDILSTNNRDGVGDHMAARHLVERREMRKARGADLEAVGFVRAVGD